MELTYTRVGDYLIPDLTAGMDEDADLAPLGRYGRLRERFLKEHYHGTYTSMLLTGQLESHLYQLTVRPEAGRPDCGPSDEDKRGR